MSARPDPYASHAVPNPEWSQNLGTPIAMSKEVPAEVKVKRHRKSDRLVKRLVILLIVVALGVVGWIQREPIGDAVDKVVDKVQDWTGGDDPADGASNEQIDRP